MPVADPAARSLSLHVVTLVRARVRLGNLETAGKNRGPLPDGYARRAGLDPEKGAYAWCTSGLYDAFAVEATDLLLGNPFPRTAKAVRVFELLMANCYEPDPAPGRVYILDHGKPGNLAAQWKSGHYTDDGHAGIVTDVDADGVPFEVSGNTFADRGSREGNCWAEHHGFPEVTHGGMLLGYLDLDRAVRLRD